jgi:hypothetical protein
MPAATLHLTFVELLADAGVEPEVARAIRARVRQARLGAMLYDVPFYSNVVLMAIRYGLSRPAEARPLGTLIHHGGLAAALYANLVTRLRRAAELPRDDRLALLAGAASHIALDAAQHDLMRFIARRQMAAAGKGDESHHHRLAEKFQSLFFHVDRFGRDIIGTREWLERTRLTEGASIIFRRHEPAVTTAWLGALRDTYGDAPTEAEWTSQLRAFVHFGLLTSSYPARRNSRLHGTPEKRRTYYSNELFHFPDHMDAATRLAERLLTLSLEYYDDGRFDEATRRRFIGELALPRSIAVPEATDAPKPYEVPPLPARFGTSSLRPRASGL